jgi:serine/threonine-protein kinase SRK2
MSAAGTSRDGGGSDDSMSEANPLYSHPYYSPVKVLSRGAAGSLQLATDTRKNTYVVIKLLERGPGVTKNLERELLAHRRCHAHPNIVQLKEVFLTTHYLAIVMEYMKGSNMPTYLAKHAPLPEPVARWFFQQLVLVFDFYHRLGLKNREVRLHNLMLASDSPRSALKISDFEYSKTEQVNSDPKSALGTLAYTAPEALMHNFFDGSCSDVWCCGVMLYIMVTGKFPFGDPEAANGKHGVQNMIAKIMKVNYEPPEGLSPELEALLRSVLVADPAKRPSVAQLLQNPWVAVGLPPGMLQCNEKVLRMHPPASMQSEEDMQRIAREARVPVMTGQGEDIDGMADDVMDQDEMEDLLDDLELEAGNGRNGQY